MRLNTLEDALWAGTNAILRLFVICPLFAIGQMCQWAYRFSRCCCGVRSRGIVEGKNDGTGYLITLLIVGVSQSAGLSFAETQPEPRWQSLVPYVVMSFITIWSVVMILRSKQTMESGQYALTFSDATVVFGRWVIGCLVCLTFFTIALATTGNMFTQSRIHRTTLHVTHAEPYAFTQDSPELNISKDDRGVAAYTTLSWAKYPDPLQLEVELSDQLRTTWQITQAIGYIGDHLSTEETTPIAMMIRSNLTWKKKVLWNQLVAGKTYTLKVLLHPLKPTAKPEELQELLTNDKDAMIFQTYFLE